MCDMGITGLVLTGLSAVMGVVGQAQQAQQAASAQKAQAEYNSQVAANEAEVQRQLAQNEMSKGIADRERQQRAAARAMGEMRAGMGASGFTLDSGSNLSLLAESAQEHQYDSNVIMSNAAQAAWQHEIGVTNALNNQNFAEWQGSQANGSLNPLAVGGTILGGLGTAVGQYGLYSQNKNAGGTLGDTFRKNAGKSQYIDYY